MAERRRPHQPRPGILPRRYSESISRNGQLREAIAVVKKFIRSPKLEVPALAPNLKTVRMCAKRFALQTNRAGKRGQRIGTTRLMIHGLPAGRPTILPVL